MDKIEYVELTADNFNLNSLDGFKRRQKVTHCWRKAGNDYTLKPVSYTEDWSLAECRELANKILNGVLTGAKAFGAICGEKIIGFAFIKPELFGSGKQYIDLAEFYVSEPFRRKGVGRALFTISCNTAKKLGAAKLYISAHSAEESIAAYKSYGCVLAKEINRDLAEKEPFDLQLECEL